MATNFGTKIVITGFVTMIATRQLVIERGLSGLPTECRYSRHLAPQGRCHGNHFLAFYIWVHIGATWRIRLNRRLRRQCGLMSNYFDRLLLFKYENPCITLQHAWLKDKMTNFKTLLHHSCRETTHAQYV